jgi:hypothetical protein
MKLDGLPDIPNTWLIALFLVSLTVLRICGFDSYVTAGLMAISGYLFGYHQGQTSAA